MCSKSETFKWLEQMNDRSLLFNLRAGLNTRIKFMNIAMNLSMALVESTTWTTPRVSGASLDQVQVPSKRHNIKLNYDKLCMYIKGIEMQKVSKSAQVQSISIVRAPREFPIQIFLSFHYSFDWPWPIPTCSQNLCMCDVPWCTCHIDLWNAASAMRSLLSIKQSEHRMLL